LVSIVVPVLNGERHIEECLNSLCGQTFSDIEIVVSLNSSIDRTAAIVHSCDDARIRVLPEVSSLLSVQENWSRGLAAARGEFVKIVCHDDLLAPEAIAVQVDLLRGHPGAALTASRRRIIDDNGAVLIRSRGLGSLVGSSDVREVGAGEVARACTRAGTNLLGEPADVLIRRTALPEPLFEARWRYTIDLAFYLRCLRSGNAVLDRRVLASFRASPTQLSAVIATDQVREFDALMKELLQRYPGEVRNGDVRRGFLAARIITTGRRALYLKMRWGARFSRWLRRA
jgi:glycosyltransferase involved in cell wall biosynthesis